MSALRRRHATRAMMKRWEADLASLEKTFGPYNENDFSAGAEMQRNLGTAIEAARSLVSSVTATESDAK